MDFAIKAAFSAILVGDAKGFKLFMELDEKLKERKKIEDEIVVHVAQLENHMREFSERFKERFNADSENDA